MRRIQCFDGSRRRLLNAELSSSTRPKTSGYCRKCGCTMNGMPASAVSVCSECRADDYALRVMYMEDRKL